MDLWQDCFLMKQRSYHVSNKTVRTVLAFILMLLIIDCFFFVDCFFAGEEGVVSVFKNTQRQLHTTRSWDFLGLVESKYKRSVGIESNIIVGVLDTGKVNLLVRTRI